jgi:poly(3-hydroxybutyrate) depolymerase
MHPPRELFGRALDATRPIPRPVEDAVRRDVRFPVTAEQVSSTPFLRLVRLRGPATGRHFLLLAPHSGYAAAVVSPLVAFLLGQGEVLVTEWTDARLAPAAAGPFGLADQVATGLRAATSAGAPVHLVALSQSGPAALACAARLAADGREAAPASLAFLGCQLDPRVAPTALQQALGSYPREVLAHGLTTRVPAGQAGAGRRVYPALYQFLAYGLASPGLYAEIQGGLLRELATGRSGDYDRQHLDLHSLLDVPVELFLDMLAWQLDGSPWRGETVLVGGKPYDTGTLLAVPVLAVEAGADDLVGRGQTHALGRRLPQVRSTTLPGASHHDLFTGPGFAAATAPTLRRFYDGLA